MSARRFDKFDEFVGSYREIHNENIKLTGADSDYFSEYRVEEILRVESKVLDINRELKILDIGSGDGNAARFFIKHFPNAEVYGIDITDNIVNSAKARNLKNCYFQVYDGENIPFGDNFFDIVFLTGTLHHIDRYYHSKLMEQAHRVLKPSCRMYNFEHNPWNPVSKKLVKDCAFDVNAVLVTAPYVKQLEKNAGFKNPTSHFTLFFPRYKIFKPFLTLEKYISWLPIGGQYYIKATK